jgi:hypothetical protein
MSKRASQFQTIRTEGAILPPDILRSIAALAVDGVSADSYHLPPSTKLNEAISQAWTALLAHWKAFREAREKLPAHDETGTALTNERWLLPLFKELDYGRLTTSKSPEIDGRTYSIERFYQHTPIHLIGCNLPLDRRTRGARGAATASPHSMMQEYLNRADNSLWGFLSNGLSLRILRDNVSLSRQAYVEFDVEAMFDGEVYSDFALLWMLCHQSRVEAEKAQDCWLEKWSKLARDRGTRVLDDLRVGVTSAIEALGRGFIAHPKNDRLRDKLRTGALTTQDYYRQLLRIVYRLLFLFVAEDRGLLHPPDAGEDVCQLYDEYYSTARLRELCRSIRGSKHGDLWHALSLVFDALGSSSGLPQLGLPALGSFLWRRSSTSDLVGPAAKAAPAVEEPAFITNDDLLSAVRALAYVQQDKVLRDVDYRNLGSEELGSVYESLLELHPEMNIEGRSFSLSIAAGHERKTTGSYYTPDSLVQCLLDSALEPVVAERIRGLKAKEAENAILSLTVCDPACGSGHFLIAAAHRLARHLARVRTGESEPSPEDHQHALRDTIGHCIYGVDLNPMAVELCKVSLWIEAIEPGKPLSFLGHQIQCGNSLLGTTPALVAAGLPDDAFDAIEGDDKEVCKRLKKQNAKERKDAAAGQSRFRYELPLGDGADLPRRLAQIKAATDETLADVEAKERDLVKLRESGVYRHAEFLADSWCAAFVWKKDSSSLSGDCPTHEDLRTFARDLHHAKPAVRDEVARLRSEYHFFHWHLAFPEVCRLSGRSDAIDETHTGWQGGFDVVLGNPPWERVKLQEQEFFAQREPSIAQAPNASARKKSHLMRSTGRYPLCGRGDINTYAVFAEAMRSVLGPTGRIGAVLPTGIATDDTTKYFFASLVDTQTLVSVLSFENEEFLFRSVHHATKFCLLTVSGLESPVTQSDFVFFARQPTQINDPARRFVLTPDDIRLLSPNTLTCKVFRSSRDADLVRGFHRHFPVLDNLVKGEGGNPWKLTIRRLFDINKPAVLAMCEQSKAADGMLPVYEGKMLHQFDHRFGTYENQTVAQSNQGKLPEVTDEQHNNPAFASMPFYWMAQENAESVIANHWSNNWLLAWRDITSPNLERTVTATILPRVPTDFTVRVGFVRGERPARDAAFLLAVFNSTVFDYVARLAIGGNHLSDFILRQLPVPTPLSSRDQLPWEAETSVIDWVLPRVLELTFTSHELKHFASDLGYFGAPFRWDPERRACIRAELDAAFLHLFGVNVGDAEYIMSTFSVLRAREEARYGGCFVTRDRILTVFERMDAAMRSGTRYATLIDPAPADTRVAHPPRAQQLAYGDVVADMLLLLSEWNSAVSILALEPAVLLMQNEQARRAFLGRAKTAATTDQVQRAYKIVEGIDLVYQGLVVNGAIEPVGQNGYRLLKPELIADLSAENRQRARQVVAAIQKLDRPEDALAIVAEVTHERYAVAVS